MFSTVSIWLYALPRFASHFFHYDYCQPSKTATLENSELINSIEITIAIDIFGTIAIAIAIDKKLHFY